MEDIAFFEAKIRGLENECRELRETLFDKFAAAALTGLLSSPADEYRIDEAAEDAWRVAKAMMEIRKCS